MLIKFIIKNVYGRYSLCYLVNMIFIDIVKGIYI